MIQDGENGNILINMGLNLEGGGPATLGGFFAADNAHDVVVVPHDVGENDVFGVGGVHAQRLVDLHQVVKRQDLVVVSLGPIFTKTSNCIAGKQYILLLCRHLFLIEESSVCRKRRVSIFYYIIFRLNG